MKNIIINDISKDLGNAASCFGNYSCVVIISKYNTGKTTSAVQIIMDKFGSSNVRYLTLIDQSKPKIKQRKRDLDFEEVPRNKIIVLDEISDDKGRDIRGYFRDLLKLNKVIILTNPYGSSNAPEAEINLFRKHEAAILPENTLFVFVTNVD